MFEKGYDFFLLRNDDYLKCEIYVMEIKKAINIIRKWGLNGDPFPFS
jgi:hypothetical protein